MVTNKGTKPESYLFISCLRVRNDFVFRIEFHWSYIELDKTGLVVCENIGTLPITLSRTGDLSGVAFVGVEAQDRTTRINDDYRPSLSRQVQFDPGI